MFSAISDIIAYGSNSNGRYAKFSNGILICWGSDSITLPNENLYSESNKTLTYPMAFYDIPLVVMNLNGGYSNWCTWTQADVTINKFDAYVIIMRNGIPSNFLTYGIRYIAIGRWKA